MKKPTISMTKMPTVIMMMLKIPNCSVASPASVQNAWAYNPLGVAKNRIAGLVRLG